MKRKVVSSVKRTFKGDNGLPVELYQLYIVDDNGAVGLIYSRKPYNAGDEVILALVTDKDGKLKLSVR